jgi:hypothetical protein
VKRLTMSILGFSLRRVGIIFLILVVTVAAAFWAFPREWSIGSGDGAVACVVSRGQSLSEVVAQCGPPKRSGDQPKVANGWTTFCSAPCELRGARLLFYDCQTKVASVKTARDDEYQGCIFR